MAMNVSTDICSVIFSFLTAKDAARAAAVQGTFVQCATERVKSLFVQRLQEFDARVSRLSPELQEATCRDILTHLRKMSHRVGWVPGYMDTDEEEAHMEHEKTRRPLRRELYKLQDDKDALDKAIQKLPPACIPEGFQDDLEAWEWFRREIKFDREMDHYDPDSDGYVHTYDYDSDYDYM